LKKERNTLKVQNDEYLNKLKQYENDASNNERIIENNTKLRKQVTELQQQVDDLKKQTENLQRAMEATKSEPTLPSVNAMDGHHQYEKAALSPRGPNPDRMKQHNVPSQEALERIEKEERKANQKIADLTQQIRSMQSEKDIAHIQNRVEVNKV
jgi:phage shock protein A